MLGLELFRRLGRIAVGISRAEVIRLETDGVIVDGKGEVVFFDQLFLSKEISTMLAPPGELRLRKAEFYPNKRP